MENMRAKNIFKVSLAAAVGSFCSVPSRHLGVQYGPTPLVLVQQALMHRVLLLVQQDVPVIDDDITAAVGLQ